MSVDIDIGTVLNTAQAIDNINGKINNSFADMEHSVSNMDNVWHGLVAERATNDFFKIKRSFYAQRSNVISDLTRFLRQTVSSSYQNLENELESNAKKFK